MASDNLVLRGGTWHARMVIPSDVRHILNRREFTASLKTGNKTEAQRKKSPLLFTWQDQIDEARSKISGNGDDWKEKAWRRSLFITEKFRDGITGLALNEADFLAQVSQKGITAFYEQIMNFLASRQKNGLFDRAQMNDMENSLGGCPGFCVNGVSIKSTTADLRTGY
ncbi:DUF6538 domain-containing protein [Pseudomonas synxantha]|uniref:DUF6538 domain-containing protein n=1 Tax=Pseudomonas synxantha TaxID=47883 RepID=UPI0011E4D350|nr:DUF6538 domain-containing protein [Pseudomonas synxantha]